jgi:hypothetical protein
LTPQMPHLQKVAVVAVMRAIAVVAAEVAVAAAVLVELVVAISPLHSGTNNFFKVNSMIRRTMLNQLKK